MSESLRTRSSFGTCAVFGLLALLGAAVLTSETARVNRAHSVSTAAAQTRDYRRPARPSATNVALSSYNSLPLAFEPAFEESKSVAQFSAHGRGYTIALNHNDTALVVGRGKASEILRMSLVGANTTGSLVASNRLPGKSNYILGNDAEKWRIGVPNYRTVTQRDVYPGVDVVYYGTQRELEYDFVVAPSANPRMVKIGFDGAKELRTDSTGDLLAAVGGGDVRFHKPVAYQKIAGAKKMVSVSYNVTAQHEATFQVADYDTRQPLIIDPVLSYSSVLGGSDIDGANAIAVAPDGSAFIAGGTFSSDFPTEHPLQPNVGGPNDFPQDAFVSKISADGSTLVYSTFLGGSSQDVANGIAVDAFGEAYITGTTISTDFPTTPGSPFTLCGGDGKCGASYNSQGLKVSNAFVTKLNIAGSGLIFSEYLGSYEHVHGQAIAVDSNQNVYITGQVEVNGTPTVTITPPATAPPPFPITGSAFQSVFGTGTTDAFVTKFSATGNSVLYSSYLGGSNEQIGYGIAVDNNGVAYLTGLTYSTDFPVKMPLQAAAGGAGDAFIAKVDTNGSGANSLLFSTYLGGNGLDQGNGIALDSLTGNGNFYVTGTTSSTTLQGSANNGQGDAFALKLSPSQVLVYFRLLGGSQADAGLGIAADATGNAYVTGSTVSTDFPVVGSVFQKTFGGGNADGFITKLDPTTGAIIYSTYLGGTNTEIGNGIAVDANGSAYVTGQTCSSDFPLSNPLSTTGPLGNCDAFISKVSTQGGIAANPGGLSFQTQSVGTASAPQSITITNTNDSATITISSITSSSADFIEADTCKTPLAAGATCVVNVQFQPTAPGTRKGMITVTSNAVNPNVVLNLTGATSNLALSASNLAFGNQQVSVQSPAQSVVVTNNGGGPVTISNIVPSGDFAQTNSCTAAPIPAGTNCVINVTYKPSAIGTSIGAVTISYGAPGSPQSILLTGTGVLLPASLSLSSTNLSFGSLLVGVVSSPQTVTVTNTGTSTLVLSAIAASGDFSQTNSCTAASLPAGTTCVISVTYKPSAAGASVGAVTITDNATGNPHMIQLTGSGFGPTAGVTLSPASLSFGSQPIGVLSSPQTVRITNNGTGTLTISAISASGDFSQTNSCTSPLPAGTNCLINVTYKPSGAGSGVGAITITDNAPASPQTVGLTGTGVSSGFSISSPITNATVSAGETATYSLTVTPVAGFSQPIAFACSNLPREASCVVSPNPVSMTGATATNVSISIVTGLRTLAPGAIRKFNLPLNLRMPVNPWIPSVVLIIALVAIRNRRRPALTTFGLAAVLLLVATGCGSGNQSGVPAGTPAGSYQVTVTGTAGSLANTITLNLQVN